MTHGAAWRGEDDPVATAKAIIDANLYMVLGTADEGGHPWVSPVYYAPVDHREFLWVSWPETLHSRNLVGRPQISIVIFDSSVPIGSGQGVYMAGTAEEVTGDARAPAIDVFSRRSLEHGAACGRSMIRSRRPSFGSTARPQPRTTSWVRSTDSLPSTSDQTRNISCTWSRRRSVLRLRPPPIVPTRPRRPGNPSWTAWIPPGSTSSI